MSGKKETLLERILKPIRINPITLGVSLASFGIGGLLLNKYLNSNNTPAQIFSFIMLGLGQSPLFLYFKYGVKSYFRDKNSLAEHGFDIRYGKLRMEEYCDRQAFYVACVEKGYREEVLSLINDFPNEQKRGKFFPRV